MNTQDMINAITNSLNNDTTALRKVLLGGVIAGLASMSDDQLQNLCQILGISTS